MAGLWWMIGRHQVEVNMIRYFSLNIRSLFGQQDMRFFSMRSTD